MKVGEIIAVATTTFSAQSYELNRAPVFGGLLHVPGGEGMSYYALCYAAQTGSIEPGRHAVAWGRFEDDETDLYRRQPQLNQVLRTTFDALLVGYHDGATLVQRVPAMPPRLHAVVHDAAPDEIAAFNAQLGYLRFIVRTPLPNADDFIAATIDRAYRALGCDRAFLVSAARTVARLLEPEHERVMNVLELLDG